jgi:hypothetical protein
MLPPWEKELHSNYIYKEVGNVDMIFTSLEGTSLDKYKYFFQQRTCKSRFVKSGSIFFPIPCVKCCCEKDF